MTYPAQPSQPAPVDTPVHSRGTGRRRTPWATRDDMVAGAYVVAALAVVGALLGVIWQWWSPPGPLGFVVASHAIQPDETEAFVAADGRFAIIGAAVGLVAGFAVWSVKATRGPVAALALVVGGLSGSLLTDVVGHLLAGGAGNGKPDTILRELPLSVHMRGLLLLESAVAVLVYGLCVSFAADDDLGRGDPDGSSVGIGGQVQFGGGDRNAPGTFQQPYLPPQ